MVLYVWIISGAFCVDNPPAIPSLTRRGYQVEQCVENQQALLDQFLRALFVPILHLLAAAPPAKALLNGFWRKEKPIIILLGCEFYLGTGL